MLDFECRTGGANPEWTFSHVTLAGRTIQCGGSVTALRPSPITQPAALALKPLAASREHEVFLNLGKCLVETSISK